MRYQGLEWSCGPASVVNACRTLGLRVSESRVRSLAGASAGGTDEQQLISAIRSLGLTASEYQGSDMAAAWAFVRSNLMDGKPQLLCIDQWKHWVCAIGMVGQSVIVFDPDRTVKNSRENGVVPMTRRILQRRWRCRNEQEPFYAIAVGR